MHKLIITAVLSTAVFLLSSPAIASTPSEDIASVGLAGRRLELLQHELEKPFPNDQAQALGNGSAAALGKLDYALAAFTLHNDAAATARANQDLHDLLLILQSNPESAIQFARGKDGHPSPADIFHFGIAQILYWIIKNFGSSGVTQRRLLDPHTEHSLEQIFLRWGHANCAWFTGTNEHVWDIWGSENHDALADSACWAAAGIADQIRQQDAQGIEADESQPASQDLWTEFLIKTWKTRLRHITLVEYFSPTYSKYTLLNLYLYAQLSDNPELRKLATDVIDLWWAIWAQEQIDGIDGGSKTRVYPKTIGREFPMQGTAWLYFGIGRKPAGFNPGEALMVTSRYVPSRVISDLARDIRGRGTYEIVTTAPGAVTQASKNLVTRIEPGNRSIIRVAYVDPDFVMGLAITPQDSSQDWAAFSSQNRWSGVIMAGGDPSDEVVAAPDLTNGRTAYNAYWGVQTKATQILQFVEPPKSHGARQLRIWFGPNVKIINDHGWAFVDARAFVAVRPAFGGYHWESDHLLAPNIVNAPIIIQAASRSQYRDVAEFEQAIFQAPLTVDNDSVFFAGLLKADPIKFFFKSGKSALINGKPLLFSDEPILLSPFIKIDRTNNEIIIRKNDGNETIPLGP